MDEPSYRSYVIRAWRSGHGDDARARIRIERVESGEQVDLSGDAARLLAASVESAIVTASHALTTEAAATAAPAGGAGEADGEEAGSRA